MDINYASTRTSIKPRNQSIILIIKRLASIKINLSIVFYCLFAEKCIIEYQIITNSLLNKFRFCLA